MMNEQIIADWINELRAYHGDDPDMLADKVFEMIMVGTEGTSHSAPQTAKSCTWRLVRPVSRSGKMRLYDIDNDPNAPDFDAWLDADVMPNGNVRITAHNDPGAPGQSIELPRAEAVTLGVWLIGQASHNASEAPTERTQL